MLAFGVTAGGASTCKRPGAMRSTTDTRCFDSRKIKTCSGPFGISEACFRNVSFVSTAQLFIGDFLPLISNRWLSLNNPFPATEITGGDIVEMSN